MRKRERIIKDYVLLRRYNYGFWIHLPRKKSMRSDHHMLLVRLIIDNNSWSLQENNPQRNNNKRPSIEEDSKGPGGVTASKRDDCLQVS